MAPGIPRAGSARASGPCERGRAGAGQRGLGCAVPVAHTRLDSMIGGVFPNINDSTIHFLLAASVCPACRHLQPGAAPAPRHPESGGAAGHPGHAGGGPMGGGSLSRQQGVRPGGTLSATQCCPSPLPLPPPVMALVMAPVTAMGTALVMALVTAPVTAPVIALVMASIMTLVMAPVMASIMSLVTASIMAPVVAPVTAPVTALVTAPGTAVPPRRGKALPVLGCSSNGPGRKLPRTAERAAGVNYVRILLTAWQGVSREEIPPRMKRGAMAGWPLTSHGFVAEGARRTRWTRSRSSREGWGFLLLLAPGWAALGRGCRGKPR